MRARRRRRRARPRTRRRCRSTEHLDRVAEIETRPELDLGVSHPRPAAPRELLLDRRPVGRVVHVPDDVEVGGAHGPARPLRLRTAVPRVAAAPTPAADRPSHPTPRRTRPATGSACPARDRCAPRSRSPPRTTRRPTCSSVRRSAHRGPTPLHHVRRVHLGAKARRARDPHVEPAQDPHAHTVDRRGRRHRRRRRPARCARARRAARVASGRTSASPMLRVTVTTRRGIDGKLAWLVVSTLPPETTPPEGFRQHRFAPPPGSTTVLLVRHGESAPAHPDRPFPLHDGHGDPPLDPVGVRQAELLAQRLATEPIAAIYVTTLQRTHETAAPLAKRLGISPSVVADLREVYLGEWEGGRLRERAAAGDPLFHDIFVQERWDVIPGAEPHDEFDTRDVARLRARRRRAPRRTHRRRRARRRDQPAPPPITGARRFAFSGADNASISESWPTRNAWCCVATTTLRICSRCCEHADERVAVGARSPHARRELELYAPARDEVDRIGRVQAPEMRRNRVEVGDPAIAGQRPCEPRRRGRQPGPDCRRRAARSSSGRRRREYRRTRVPRSSRRRARRTRVTPAKPRVVAVRRDVPAQIVGLHDRVVRRAGRVGRPGRDLRRSLLEPSVQRAEAEAGTGDERLFDTGRREQRVEHRSERLGARRAGANRPDASRPSESAPASSAAP